MKNRGFISLKEGFKSVKQKSHYVASAVFPLMLSKSNDLNIVFFNYWTNKNKIQTKYLKLFIKIHDHTGELICHHEEKIFDYHNQHSISQILNKNKIRIKNLYGMVNIEIVSLEKLSFPFPAIIGIYKSGNFYSSVHSAGRIKNNSEIQNKIYTEETNWTCKFDKGVTPFFHFFVGNKKPEKSFLTVKILNDAGKIKNSKKVDINFLNPFGSKIFFIKDLFKNAKFKNTDFVSVEVEHNSIIPRMVVGNYFYKKNIFETTHSFPRIVSKDYCPNDKKFPFQSKMTGYRNKDLDLQLKIFPTSCEGKFTAETFTKNFHEEKLTPVKEVTEISKKKLKKKIIIPFKKNEEFKSLKFKGNKIPSRLNTSFVYKVRNLKNNYSVDIASGAKSTIYPKKYTHWGHGYIAENFETIIMIANDNYEYSNNEVFSGVLDVYSEKFHKKINVKINSGSVLTVNLSKIIDIKKTIRKKLNFLSWHLRLKTPGCECFWVSFRKKDGSIFGDHSF
ncbi:MAG: hypothetical protein CMJ01_04155 [Pelagibacteraceae bacterium]|nr:hypothetical protein [Pelagibacteraceae bacterium]|tara:strand:- start:9595 stop:11103 length:1509 start_codon:yes stop_codon:yes gene_type:complete